MTIIVVPDGTPGARVHNCGNWVMGGGLCPACHRIAMDNNEPFDCPTCKTHIDPKGTSSKRQWNQKNVEAWLKKQGFGIRELENGE